MNKQFRTTVMAAALAGAMVVGAAASTAVQKITAELRPDITVKVDGEKATLVDKNGNIVYPVTYGGTTYLPIRALGNLMDMEVGWNSQTQTVSLTKPTSTKPEDLTLEKLTARTEDVEAEVKALKPAASYADRAEQYALHSETIDTLRDDLYDFSQKVNQQLRDEEISYKDYNVTTAKIDDLDVRLKDALSDLEKKTIADESDKTTLAEQLSAELDALAKRVKAQETEISDLKSAGTYAKRLEQYSEIAPDLAQLSGDVNSLSGKLNSYLRQEKLTYKEYNSLSQRAGDLDVRVKDAWDDLAEKTIMKDDDQPSKPTEDTRTYDSYVEKIGKLDDKADQLVKDVQNHRPAHGQNNNKQAWKAIERKIDDLDDEIDDMEDALERDYRNGYLTSAQYKELDRTLDRVDDKIDDLDDWYDFDD